MIDATGFLHMDGFAPEKSCHDLDGAHMARALAVNAIGPALLMKRRFQPVGEEDPRLAGALPAQDGHLMSQGDEIELQGRAAAYPEGEPGIEGGQKVTRPMTV